MNAERWRALLAKVGVLAIATTAAWFALAAWAPTFNAFEPIERLCQLELEASRASDCPPSSYNVALTRALFALVVGGHLTVLVVGLVTGIREAESAPAGTPKSLVVLARVGRPLAFTLLVLLLFTGRAVVRWVI